jgi:DNA-binding beta-propeller fold protein YncE
VSVRPALVCAALCGISAAQVITTVAGTNFTFPHQPLPAVNAPLSTGLNSAALDAAGNVYVADSLNNVVVRLGTDGMLSIVAGNGIYGFSGDGGPATSAALAYPTGVAVDPAGNVFVSDSRNLRVREVSNGIIATVAGTGQQGYTGEGGPAINATFGLPAGVALDSVGNLFIIDHTATAGASAVVREVSNGKITSAVGSSAALNTPAGIAVDTAGNLYIADIGSNKLHAGRAG